MTEQIGNDLWAMVSETLLHVRFGVLVTSVVPWLPSSAPFGSVSGLFRVRFGSVSGPLGGVGVGSVRGASVREQNITRQMQTITRKQS